MPRTLSAILSAASLYAPNAWTLWANLSISNSRFWFMLWRREEVTADREGWKSEVKDWRVSKAAVWEGSERRWGSMVEGAGGSEGRGGRRTALSGGGRRRDSQVWRSVCRLDHGILSVIACFLSNRRRVQSVPGYLLLQVLYLGWIWNVHRIGLWQWRFWCWVVLWWN